MPDPTTPIASQPASPTTANEAPQTIKARPQVKDAPVPERLTYSTRSKSPSARHAAQAAANAPPAPVAPAADAKPVVEAPKAPEAGEAKLLEASADDKLKTEVKDAAENSKLLLKKIEFDKKLAEHKQTMSKEREALKVEREAIAKTQAALKAFQDDYKADLVGALQKHLGLTSDDLYKAVIDDGKKFPTGRPKDVAAPTPQAPKEDPILADIRKNLEELNKAKAEQAEKDTHNQISRVKQEIIAPLLKANPERYSLLVAMSGDNASTEVWTVCEGLYAPLIKEYGHISKIPQSKQPTFEQAADRLEAYLKSQAETFDTARKVKPSDPKAATPDEPTNKVAKKQEHNQFRRSGNKTSYVVKQRPE